MVLFHSLHNYNVLIIIFWHADIQHNNYVHTRTLDPCTLTSIIMCNTIVAPLISFVHPQIIINDHTCKYVHKANKCLNLQA